MIKKWKQISSKLLLDNPRIKVFEDKVLLPDGKQATYVREGEAVNHSVAVIAINSKNEILLQLEYSYPPDEVLYQLPGGSMELDEDIIEAGNRELSEESGFRGKDCHVLGSFYMNNRRSNRKQYVVLCKDLIEKKIPNDAEEFIVSEWMSLDKLNALIKDKKISNMNLLAALKLFELDT